MYLYINQANAEAVFTFLAIVGVIGVIVAWFITRRPSHKRPPSTP